MEPKSTLDVIKLGVDALSVIEKLPALLPTVKPAPMRRASDHDPRLIRDRRRSPLERRLETGIWLHFHYLTGFGKNQSLDSSYADDLIRAFVNEGENYQFYDRNSSGTLLMPASIANSAAEHACAKWLESPQHKRFAVILTEEFGKYVYFHYGVNRIDRRQKPKPRTFYDSVGEVLYKAKCHLFPDEHHPMRRRNDWEPGQPAGQTKDRRISGIKHRLLVGTWIQYHRKTDCGVTEVLKRPNPSDLAHAFTVEGQNYEFLDRRSGNAVKPGEIADPAADYAHAQWVKLSEQERQAFVLIEELADYVFDNYTVNRIDRRGDNKHSAMAG
jgi:hypothetical protein